MDHPVSSVLIFIIKAAIALDLTAPCWAPKHDERRASHPEVAAITVGQPKAALSSYISGVLLRSIGANFFEMTAGAELRRQSKHVHIYSGGLRHGIGLFLGANV